MTLIMPQEYSVEVVPRTRRISITVSRNRHARLHVPSVSQAKNPCVNVGHKGAMNAALSWDP